jgi:hypothetical protein
MRGIVAPRRFGVARTVALLASWLLVRTAALRVTFLACVVGAVA